jgi:hypothetical protein
VTPFAFLQVNPDRIAAVVVNLLAVAGGFLAGMILFGVAAYFVDKKLTGGKSPGAMHMAARWVGGLIGAVLVALLVFGDGFGTGPGDGPGQTEKTGPGAGTGTQAATPVTAKTTDTPQPPEVTPPPPGTPTETLQVTVLSGADVKEAKFYVVGGDDPTPKTLDAVKKEIAARVAAAGAKPIAVQVVLAGRTDRQGSGVQTLISAAQQAGAQVLLPGPR